MCIDCRKQLSQPFFLWSCELAAAAFSPAERCLPVVLRVPNDSLPQTQYEGILCVCVFVRVSLCVFVNEYMAASQFLDRHQSLSLTPIL